MNTETGSPSPLPPPSDPKDALLLARDVDKASLALVEVQEQYDEVKDDRREERFLWICACIVLFDCAFLVNADNLAGPLIVGIIELLGLVILARRLGVEEVKELVFGLIDRINPNRD